jgi:hypothetical protein
MNPMATWLIGDQGRRGKPETPVWCDARRVAHHRVIASVKRGPCLVTDAVRLAERVRVLLILIVVGNVM